MADDVQDIAIYTGSEWTSLSELAAGVVDAKLPIESVDGTVKLDGASSVFTVSTGNAGQIRLEPGTTSNNYLRVYDTGSPNGAMLCARNSVSNAFTLRPFKETVTGNAFSGFSLLWDYTASTVDFTNPAKNFAVSAYNAPSPACKGDRYYAFNVGGINSQTDFTLAAGLHLNVANNLAADKEAYNILVEGTAPSRFESELQAPSVRGLADNDSQITLRDEVEVRTDGRFIVAPQTRGPTLTDAVITAGSWNNSKGARLEFGWPNVNTSDYFARAAIRKDGATADLVYAHYNLTGVEQDQNGHVFYSNVAGQVGVGNKVFEVREGFAAFSVKGVERLVVDDTAAEFSVPVKTPSISGLADTDASVTLGGQATLKQGDGSEYVPTDSASIATKKIVDDKIWVGTTAEYLAIPIRDILPTTLYCLTD